MVTRAGAVGPVRGDSDDYGIKYITYPQTLRGARFAIVDIWTSQIPSGFMLFIKIGFLLLSIDLHGLSKYYKE